MLLFPSIKLIAFAAFVLLALIGAIVFAGSRGGWSRNGYFTVPAVILVVLGLFIFFQGVGSGITLALMGTKIELHPVLALSINGLAEIGVLLIGSLLISRAAGQDPFAVFRLEGFRETPATAYLLAIPTMFLAQIAGVALSALSERFWKLFPEFFRLVDNYESASDQSMQGLVTATGPFDFILIVIFVAIIPALAEETLFRGFAQTNIERSGYAKNGGEHTRPMFALLIASFLFALVHGYVFKFPGLFVLGLTLGWMSYRTNNLFTGALAHAFNNGFIVATLYLSPESASASPSASLVGAGDISGSDALIMLAVSLPFFAAALYLFRRVTEPLDARHNAERELQERHAPIPYTVLHSEHPDDHE